MTSATGASESRSTFGRPVGFAAAVVIVAALGIAWLLHERSEPPTAAPGRGSEDAFATGAGLRAREIVAGRGPMRWVGARGEFVFVHLPPPPYTVEVRIHGHVGPVAIDESGTTIGEIGKDRFVGRFTLPATATPGTARIVLRPSVLRSDPALGAQIDRIRIVYPAPGRLPLDLALLFIVPALCVFAASLWAGLSGAGGAAAVAIVSSAWLGALVWPDGIVRSPYAVRAALGTATCAAVAACVARGAFRDPGEAALRRAAFAATLLLGATQVLVATHPNMVISDAVFHANKLAGIARGEWFPTSQTQHPEPFRIPYGVSFYAVLSPLDKLGIERVALVRWGAALATVVAGLVLLRAWGRLMGVAGVVAVALTAVLPQAIDLVSFGNLSNLFGQAATVALLAWWVGSAPHVLLGITLVVLAGTAHLSSLIVLVAALAGMALADRARLRPRRLAAATIGLTLVGLYYAPFAGLVADQLPRLLEGAGPRPGGGLWRGLVGQCRAVVGAFGGPALLLAAAGLAAGAWRVVPLAIRGYTLGAAALAVPALVSPVEVRYLLALGPAVALLAALGVSTLWRAGVWGRILAAAAVLLQLQIFVARAIEAVLHRYRV